MRDQLKNILLEAKKTISEAVSGAELEEIRVRFLGKKGQLTAILRGMGSLSAEERPVIGQLANDVRSQLEALISSAAENIKQQEYEAKIRSETIDVTVPPENCETGKLHPMTNVLRDIYDIFCSMGFSVAEGPEVETVHYNFDILNTPDSHPARSRSDTFYFTDELLLRTQTSPVQAHIMETQKPPIRVIVPGRVYRMDELDATHSPAFNQIEGLVIDKGVTMGDLKGTLALFAKKMYGESAQVRFRPHYFPFTEPSAEMDIMCFQCQGKGCRLCKGEGWIEILGCGMVHPNVLRNCGIDPKEYSGFAFGIGLERLTMRRYNIGDLRHLYENDIRFLKQF